MFGSTFNPNTFTGLVGKVRKNYLPKEEGREGGEKSARSEPAGAGAEPGTYHALGEGPQLLATGVA